MNNLNMDFNVLNYF